MNLKGVLLIIGVFVLIALIPFSIALIAGRGRKGTQSGLFILAAAIVLLPLVQLFVMAPLNGRYVARLWDQADKAKIVGRDYAYVVSVLGTPDMVGHEPAATIISASKEVTVVGEPYTALRYWQSGYLLMTPQLLIIIGNDGRVKNFRVKD